MFLTFLKRLDFLLMPLLYLRSLGCLTRLPLPFVFRLQRCPFLGVPSVKLRSLLRVARRDLRNTLG